ncbi:MAG: hypothetical protein ACLRPC_04090 [Streptococcus sp.]
MNLKKKIKPYYKKNQMGRGRETPKAKRAGGIVLAVEQKERRNAKPFSDKEI